MYRGFIKPAVRAFVANSSFVLLSLLSLTVGITAALLAALYINDELSFERFLANEDLVYTLTARVETPGEPQGYLDYTPAQVIRWIEIEAPSVKAAARLAYDRVSISDVQGGGVTQADIAWVDPNFFQIVEAPVLIGDLDTALSAPDTVVLTETAAKRYFGRVPPLGAVLEFNRQRPMRVTAILRDLPAATHLVHEVYASGSSAQSMFKRLEATPFPPGFLNTVMNAPGNGPMLEAVRGRTYLQFGDRSAARAFERELAALNTAHSTELKPSPESTATLHAVAMSDLHLQQFRGSTGGVTEANVDKKTLYALGLLAAGILTLGIVNFVNLSTAHANRRAVEVGVRKMVGAARGQLVIQFMSEAVICAILATAIGVALTWLLLPSLNAFLFKDIALPLAAPAFILSLLALGACIGLLAGAYPALILTGFKPAIVLKGGIAATSGSPAIRQALVVVQVAVMVTLFSLTLVTWAQSNFVMNRGLKLDPQNVMVVDATPCRGAFEDELRRQPGVSAVACSSRAILGIDDFSPINLGSEASVAGGTTIPISLGLVDFDFFDVYGIDPVAGRVFSRSFPGDELPPMRPGTTRRGSIVLNQAAAARLGFQAPERAVGQQVFLGAPPAVDQFEVVGVVPDFTLNLAAATVKPTGFLIDFAAYPLEQVVNVKLEEGAPRASTASLVDRTWTASGNQLAIRRQFLEDYLERVNVGTLRQQFLLTMLSAVALLLACLGLLGMSAHTAKTKTKEIALRKALGASTKEVLGLLMWQFTKPVLLAAAIGAPVAYLVARSWLVGFPYRIDLGPGPFVIAIVAAVLIAWATVATHAVRVSRLPPAQALRYE